MKEIHIEDKLEYLRKYYPLEEIPKLDEKKECLHCGQIIVVSDYKVIKEEGAKNPLICCPNAPECDGTVIDWIPIKDT